MEGNQMKIREALERLYNKIVSMQCDTSSQKRKVDECRMIIRKMLSLSPRNCDVGTPVEQADRFYDHCLSFKLETTCDKCPLVDSKPFCEFAWAQMPYEAQEGVKK